MYARPVVLASLALLSSASWAACSVYDESLLEPEGTSASATSTSATGTGGGGQGGGGQGGALACTSPTDCPGQDGECQSRTCTEGLCGVTYAAAGTALASQTPGDCRVAQCDGAGSTEEASDPGDPADDDNECTDDACSGTTPTHAPVSSGSPCSSGGVLCNADGACVECLIDADCPSFVCDDRFKCAPASCGDSVENNDETDVDCGGLVCPPCVAGQGCTQDTDCTGGDCTAGQCAANCLDQVKNESETDVDCGGADCGPCGPGETCLVGADCVDLVCSALVCQAASCSDGVKNGGELGVDCGGPACGACPTNHLVLNEVEYDEVGTDSDEFVEIYNNTGAPVSLANYSLVLVNGSTNLTYKTVSLASAGTLADKQYLVVGAATVIAAAGALKIDFGAATNNIENGAPDGVALVDTGAMLVVDALSYEGSITAATVTGAGTTTLVEGQALAGNVADSNSLVGSLCRLPNGTDANEAATDWAFSGTPTPGAANVP